MYLMFKREKFEKIIRNILIGVCVYDVKEFI